MKSRSVLIKAELIKLLNDDSQEVLQGLVPNLTRALHNLMHNQTNSPGYVSPHKNISNKSTDKYNS